jgi:hypothetical protein
MATTPEPDLIDRIAVALPKQVRVDYYREVAHCQRLDDFFKYWRMLTRAIIQAAGGGGSRIRTHEGVTPLTVFKTAAFNHSAIPPRS